MNAFWSRILISVLLLPVVIGLVYLGGWWLFGLALVAGLIALHELYTLGRDLKPLVLAGYVGFVLALLGAEVGGLSWMAGGVLVTFVFAFLFFGLSHERPSATTSFGVTVLGAVWVGTGLGFLLILRDNEDDDHGFWVV